MIRRHSIPRSATVPNRDRRVAVFHFAPFLVALPSASRVPRKKPQKIRVDFRKNRQNRRRQNDFTRDAKTGDEADTDDLSKDERLTGKGDLTRRRTIVAEDVGDGPRRTVDEAACLKGRVLSAVGLTSLVEAEDGRRFECSVRRVVRTMSRDQRNVVVTGDDVLFLPTGTKEGVIERIGPRRSTISRDSQRHEHILVANVDQAAIVVSADDPPLKPALIDRFLVSAEKGGVRGIVCINKVDLKSPASLQPLVGLYSRMGYDVVLTSASSGRGIERLRTLLKGRETVFTGQSGVGKSSLLNEVQPDWKLKTGEVSGWTKKGTHTTRRAVLLRLDGGGWAVDTPGIRQMVLWDVRPEEVEGYFVEFRPFVAGCRFPDCTHTHESGCGVKRAVADEMISPLRYESYLRIIEGDEGIELPEEMDSP